MTQNQEADCRAATAQSALAQIREAYRALCRGPVADQKQLAEGLIAPAIRRLEATADLLQSLQVRAEAAESQCAVLTREVAIHKGSADDIYAKWAEERAAKETAEKALADAMAVVREIAEIPTGDESPGTAPDPTMDELIWAARAFLSTTGGDNG